MTECVQLEVEYKWKLEFYSDILSEFFDLNILFDTLKHLTNVRLRQNDGR